MSQEDDQIHMSHALRLAARGNGMCWPNPSVGCVIVKDGRVIGRGTTQAGGRPHAERVALAQAGDAARGATAYVTLEPCAHHGKTSPCAEALAAAGISRVVTAITDPDPRVAGGGHAILRAAGIEVTEGIGADQALRVTQGFLKRVTRGLPFVTLKLATTLDGRIATRTGESRWITGPQSRRMVHMMRASHDAVLVGSRTARADNPDLSVRDLGVSHQPVRIVIDGRLSLPATSRLGASARQIPVWMLHGDAAPPDRIRDWQATGARLLPVQMRDGHPDPVSALRALAAQGLTRILCEGGGTLAASLLGAGLVDDLALFTAGRLIGADGTACLGALGISALADAPQLQLREARILGPDSYSLWSLS